MDADPELVAKKEIVERRLGDLQKQGVQFGGIGEHYLQTLLEEWLLSVNPSALRAAQRKHFDWILERLDEADVQIRRAKILSGGGPNGQI